jgi:hypothetical protein
MLHYLVLVVGLVQIVKGRKEMTDRRVIACVLELIALEQVEMGHY